MGRIASTAERLKPGHERTVAGGRFAAGDTEWLATPIDALVPMLEARIVRFRRLAVLTGSAAADQRSRARVSAPQPVRFIPTLRKLCKAVAFP